MAGKMGPLFGINPGPLFVLRRLALSVRILVKHVYKKIVKYCKNNTCTASSESDMFTNFTERPREVMASTLNLDFCFNLDSLSRILPLKCVIVNSIIKIVHVYATTPSNLALSLFLIHSLSLSLSLSFTSPSNSYTLPLPLSLSVKVSLLPPTAT